MEDIKTSENKKQKSMDLTVGHPLKQILLFALPLVFGTMFQQLYSFADTVIVGRCLGIDALAAVGATYSLHFLILGFVQGACVGFAFLWPRVLEQERRGNCTVSCGMDSGWEVFSAFC